MKTEIKQNKTGKHCVIVHTPESKTGRMFQGCFTDLNAAKARASKAGKMDLGGMRKGVKTPRRAKKS